MADAERLRELAAAADPRAGLVELFFLTPGEGVTELLLIRHAQVEVNDLNEDRHLTALGREQAAVLADFLLRYPIDAVYASNTARARETASYIAAPRGLEVAECADLRDVEQRRPFDRPLPELIAAEYGEAQVEERLALIRRDMTLDAMAPFLESSAEFGARVNNALESIIDRHSGQRVVVVTHGPVIMNYVARLLGSPRDFGVYPRLTSITRVLVRDERRTLDVLNATPHFHTL